MYKCKICGKFTLGFVTVGSCEMHSLCKDCQTRENVSKLIGTIGEEISLY